MGTVGGSAWTTSSAALDPAGSDVASRTAPVGSTACLQARIIISPAPSSTRTIAVSRQSRAWGPADTIDAIAVSAPAPVGARPARPSSPSRRRIRSCDDRPSAGSWPRSSDRTSATARTASTAAAARNAMLVSANWTSDRSRGSPDRASDDAATSEARGRHHPGQSGRIRVPGPRTRSRRRPCGPRRPYSVRPERHPCPRSRYRPVR